MDIGWIKVYRQIRSSWLWNSDEPYDRRSAWIDMLLCANHDGKTVCMDGKLVTVERGSFVTSQLKLAERWRWDRKKVRHFLELLEQDKMVTITTTTKRTTVTIENYGKFQDCGTSEHPTEGASLGQPLPTNKNIKNIYIPPIDTNVSIVPQGGSEKTARFIPPTVEEVEAYCKERNNGVNAQNFVDFYEAKGWLVGKVKMKSWKAAVRTWEQRYPKPQQELKSGIDFEKIKWEE